MFSYLENRDDFEELYDLFEPYILDKIHTMDEDNLSAALMGFAS